MATTRNTRNEDICQKSARPAPQAKPCAYCHTVFLPKYNDVRHKYCSDTCQDRAYGRHKTAQGKGFRANRPILYYKACAWCHEEFGVVAADRSTCCSRECGFKYVVQKRFGTREAQQLRCLRKRLLRLLLRLHPCHVCGKKRLGTGCCSRACVLEHGRRAHRQAKYGEKRRTEHIWKIRYAHCKQCQKLFVTHGHRIVYCSNPCLEKYTQKQQSTRKNHRKRARLAHAKHEKYSRVEIWERDKFRCYLCKKTLSPLTPFPHPRSLTLDHVIPIARGGSDTRDNVRTACFQCNSTKSGNFPTDKKGQYRFVP